MTSSLKFIQGVKSIFQVGGISDYGISDIDMLVIFENDINFNRNPLQSENKPVNRYLFTHRLFGTTENRVNELENFTRFGKYKILHGHAYTFATNLPEKESEILGKQIALEYMVKAFVSLHLALAIRQVKVRNLLLHVKALKLDLELLGIGDGLLYELVNEFISMRKKWFEKTPDTKLLQTKILQFYHAFRNLMVNLLQQFPFYLPGRSHIKISRNIELKNDIAFRPSDIRIPSFFQKIIPQGKRESVLNRLYTFRFRLPLVSHNVPDIVQLRYDYINSGVEFNRKHLSCFLCTAYGLDIFSRKS